MKTTVKEFWGNKKKAIKATVIGVSLTVTGVVLYSVLNKDKKIDSVGEEEIVEELNANEEIDESEA